MGSFYQGGRSRSRSRSHRPDYDRHEALKTSLQVIGLIICLRVLLPKMSPSERGPDEEYENSRRRRGPYTQHRSEPVYESYESLPQRRSPDSSETREVRRITYEEPRDVGGDEWDGATVVGSDGGRERRSRRRRN